MSNKVLIAGATGSLGRRVAALVQHAGTPVRGLSRRAPVTAESWIADACSPGALRGCCEGIETVFSALGASVSLHNDDRQPFSKVDATANQALLGEAVQAGVKRFVYVAAFPAPGYAWTRYMQAHEEVVKSLRRSGLSVTILRPTAFFPSLDPYVTMARKGLVPLIGDGESKTNPIDVDDLAAVAASLLWEGPPDVPIGGPEILTRRRIGQIAFESLRVHPDPHFIELPQTLARVNGKLFGLFNPRLGELMEFAAAVSVTNCVAPRYGSRRLIDYFKAKVHPPA